MKIWKHPRTTALLTSLLLVLSLLGCDMPFVNQGTLDQVKDSTEPHVVISSPLAGYECANIVEIKGTTSDLDNSGKSGKVASLFWEIPGSILSGTVPLAYNGSFSFHVMTETLDGQFTVQMTVRDWNGNTSSTSVLLLRKTGNGVPSFHAVSENKQITLEWDPVPLAASYTVYYDTSGVLPQPGLSSTTVLENVSPGDIVAAENGKLYTFQLKVVPETGGVESLSDYAQAIPLSPRTLEPTVSSGRNNLTISWAKIPGTQNFDLYRRIGNLGEYNYYRTVQGYEFVDTDVTHKTQYSYWVKPAAYSQVQSQAASGMTDGFASSWTRLIQFLSPWKGFAKTPNVVQFPGFSSEQRMLAYGDGAYIYNNKNPDSPVLLKEIYSFSSMINRAGIFTKNGSTYALFAAGTQGFSVWNVGNPALSSQIFQFPTSTMDNAGDLLIDTANERVYVIDYRHPNTGGAVPGDTKSQPDTLYCFDISNPASPVQVGSPIALDATKLNPDTDYRSLTSMIKIGNYLIMSLNKAGIKVVDTTSLGTTYANDFPGTATSVATLEHYGNYVYAQTNDGIFAFDAASKIDANPTTTTTNLDVLTALNLGFSPTTTYDLLMAGTQLLVSDRWRGFAILDLDAPDLPVIVKWMNHLSSGITAIIEGPSTMEVDGNYLYTRNDGIWFRVDPNLPMTMQQLTETSVSTSPSINPPGNMEIKNGRLYVPLQDQGFRIYDISSSGGLSLLGSYQAALPVHSVAVSGNYAYLGEGESNNGTLEIVSIADPASIVSVYRKTFFSVDMVQELACKGDYLYILAPNSGLLIYDIADPKLPLRVMDIPLVASSKGMHLEGDAIYIANPNTGAVVINIANPREAFVQDFFASGGATSVAVAGSQAITSHDNGFELTDLSGLGQVSPLDNFDLTPPILASGINTFTAVAGLGNTAIGSSHNAVTHEGKYYLWDTSNKLRPRLVSVFNRPDTITTSIRMYGPLVFSLAYTQGTFYENYLTAYTLRP